MSVGLAPRARAANFFWDTNSSTAGIGGATGNWDTTTANWFNAGTSTSVPDGTGSTAAAAFTANDIAYFAGTAGTVTLTAPITVGGLNFGVGGYAIASGTSASTLTLAAPTGSNSPVITVNNNGFGTNRATIGATLAGTSGFTKTGNGTLVLTANNSAGLSGDIAIRGGSVVITNANQLGATSGSSISVTGVANNGNPGFSGGMLILQGVSSGAGSVSGGVTLNRELTLGGRGAGAANNGASALLTVGYNILGGGLTIGNSLGETRIWGTHGTTTVSGPVNIGTGGLAGFQGNGNFFISGPVSGVENSTDRFYKSGNIIASTLWLQNAANTFASTMRTDSGTVRVQTNGALGINNGATAVDFVNGGLEVRTDAPGGFSARNLRPRNNTTGNVLFVDRDITGPLGIGSSLINQTVTFGTFLREAGTGGTTFAFNGRNGFGVTVSTGTPTAGDYRGYTINNNSSGLLTINGNLLNHNNTNVVTMTIGGNADTVVNGSVLATTTALHAFTKAGTGLLIYAGTAGNYDGPTNISGGTLSFSDVGGFNDTSGIFIGSNAATNVPAALTYTGAAATLLKPLQLNTTTASINSYLNASGSGALTVSGTITALTGAKTLVLGGTNTADNTITSAIPNAGTSALSLQKIGLGTWVLGGAVSNTFTGSTTVSGGTLKLTDGASIDLLPDAGAVIFGTDVFTNAAGGTLSYTGGANAETVGALTGTSGHGVVNAVSGSLTFASLGSRTAGSSINVSNTGTVTVNGTSAFLNAGAYFNGADFAYSNAGTLRAPVYGSDAGFVDAIAGVATLTGGSHNRVTGAITAQTTASVNSLKIDGANNLTLASGQTLTVGVGAAAAGAGILLTGGSSTISGGTALAASVAGNDFTVRVEGPNTLTISTPMTTSTAGLTKSGAGTLVLGGANTYGGTVAVNEGTLQMASGGLLGATGVGLAVRQGATFDLNGVNVGTSASGTNAVNLLTGAGTITNTSGTQATLRIGEGGTTGALYTGLLTGNLALVKAGSGTSAGTFHFTGLNTFTGPVTLVAGNLDVTRLANIGQASGIGAGDAASEATNAASLVLNGGNLRYVGTNASGALEATQTPSVSIDRLFTLAGSGGIFSFGSYGNIVQTRAANNATLIFNNIADVAFSGTGTRTLTLGGDSVGDNEMRVRLRNNPNANEALSLTVSGGLWILNPATSNSYTGATTVSGGALRAVVSGAVLGIPTNSNITLSGGVLQVAGTSFTRTLGTGAGQVQLTAGDTGFAAGTADRLVVTLSSGGALTWGSGSFNPATSLVLGSSTALGETEITNNINLGTTARIITVNNNGNTGTMITAGILSGVISGGSTAGTLTKAGGGVLILGNANT
ncbi:MAG: beta strand repeat-containing protein, partial [Opitutia bacterium]